MIATEKVALITAGGSGMGAAAANRLAADGYAIGILSSSGKGETLAGELGGIRVTGSNQSGDDLKRLVDGAMDKWEPGRRRDHALGLTASTSPSLRATSSFPRVIPSGYKVHLPAPRSRSSSSRARISAGVPHKRGDREISQS